VKAFPARDERVIPIRPPVRVQEMAIVEDEQKAA